MLRNASFIGWLSIVTLCLPAAVALSQAPARSPQPETRLGSGAPPPALLELAQTDSQNLVDRLKAIRSNGSRQYGTSSRRTANRESTSSAAPATPAPAPAPESALGEAVTPARNLPSVLVRRGRNAETPAPITEAEDLTTTAGAPSDAWNAAPGESANSSRRTARRWERPSSTPTYSTPSAQTPSTAFRSSTHGGATDLSLSQQGPTLRVEAIGPKTISVGKSATYRIRLSNQGSVGAHGVAVTVSLPGSAQILSTQSQIGSVNEATDAAGSHRVTWGVEQVSANSQQELAINLKANDNQPLDLKVDWMYRPAPLAARIEVQQPQLAANVDGPVEMRFGDTRVFKVKLSNPGNGPAENVTVNISATGANSEPKGIGTLAAGESRTLELELTANQAGTMQIRAVARGDGELQAEAAHSVRVRRAALAVKVSAPGLVYAGTTATYKIRVTNRGDAVAEGVIMQVEMPAGAENGIGVDKKPITLKQPRWRVGDLSPGTERVYSMQCDLTASGQNQLVARVQGTDNSVASDSALTMVESIADLKLVVNDPKGPVPVGQDAVYEIQVVNRGSKEARDINLVAQFSDGIEPAAATGQRAEIIPGQVVFDPIDSIPAGGQLTVKITARATKDGNLQFRAELNCGTPDTKLVAEESTRFYGGGAQSPQRSAGGSGDEPTPARR